MYVNTFIPLAEQHRNFHSTTSYHLANKSSPYFHLFISSCKVGFRVVMASRLFSLLVKAFCGTKTAIVVWLFDFSTLIRHMSQQFKNLSYQLTNIITFVALMVSRDIFWHIVFFGKQIGVNTLKALYSVVFIDILYTWHSRRYHKP